MDISFWNKQVYVHTLIVWKYLIQTNKRQSNYCVYKPELFCLKMTDLNQNEISIQDISFPSSIDQKVYLSRPRLSPQCHILLFGELTEALLPLKRNLQPLASWKRSNCTWQISVKLLSELTTGNTDADLRSFPQGNFSIWKTRCERSSLSNVSELFL